MGSLRVRASVSTGPPAPNGTIRVTGCEGNGCAAAAPTNAEMATAKPKDSFLTLHPTIASARPATITGFSIESQARENEVQDARELQRPQSASAALGPPMLIDHVDRPAGGQQRTLLPRADLAEVLAGEVERAVRLIEQNVRAVFARTVASGDAEAVRHLGPDNRHRFFELPAPAGMQSFDRRTRRLELLAQRPFRQFVRILAVRVSTEKNPL